MDPSTNPSTPEGTQLSAAVPEPLRASAPPNIAATVQLLEHGRREIGKVIAGQTELIDQALITVLSHGHALVEGVPGIAKTLLVKLLARVLGVNFGRVQATPDLMPADILGTTILQAAGAQMIFRPGPVFTGPRAPNFDLISPRRGLWTSRRTCWWSTICRRSFWFTAPFWAS